MQSSDQSRRRLTVRRGLLPGAGQRPLSTLPDRHEHSARVPRDPAPAAMGSIMDDQQSAASAAAAAPLAQGFSILDYFFPGASVLTSGIKTHLGIDLTVYVPFIVAVVTLAIVWGYVRSPLGALASDYLMSSVTIRTEDEMFNVVMLWLSKQKFSRESRHLIAATDSYNSHHYSGWSDESSDSDDDDGDDVNGHGSLSGEADSSATGEKSSNIHYTPSFGSHFFIYKGFPLWLVRSEDQKISFHQREEVSLYCLGSSSVLKELLNEARQQHTAKDESKTLIYRGNLVEARWQRCMSRLNRPFSTVILNEKVKQDLINDATEYLNPATRRWYANRGIPYRRGYLLHGPPGTGKSSLSLALAGHFRMKIYIVSLNSSVATEDSVASLFSDLPRRCIVLLEDIDSAGMAHSRDDAIGSSPEQVPVARPGPGGDQGVPGRRGATAPAGGRLSLSGLLNILDGVASQEGRILVMTTNHIEKLDKALIRPGRVDRIVAFGLADQDMTSSIFRAIYAPYENEVAPLNLGKPGQEDGAQGRGAGDEERAKERAKERAAICERVDALGRRFASKIPALEFSPAEIQGLLLRHKLLPEDAIDGAENWVAQLRRARKEEQRRGAEERRKAEEEKASDGNDGDDEREEA